MIKDNSSFRLSVKSLSLEVEPGVLNIGVQSLHDELRKLRSLEQAKFTLLPHPRDSHVKVEQDLNPEEILYSGLQIESPLDGFRLILRALENWIDRVTQRFLFIMELPQSFVITLQTIPKEPPVESQTESLVKFQAESLVQLLLLGESLLSPHDVYLNKAESHISDFGELTPGIKANLDLIRHRTKLSKAEAENLNIAVMEPFKDLGEKYSHFYSHFRQELSVIDEEELLSDHFWDLMQEKADVMRLPEIDFNFLTKECLQELYRKIESNQKKEINESEFKRKQIEEKSIKYLKEFEDLTLDLINYEAFNYDSSIIYDASAFYQEVINHIKSGAFGRGRLEEIRNFYKNVNIKFKSLEKMVTSEIYFLLSLF